MSTEEKKPLPSRTLELSIGNNKYIINFPKTGELIDIQTMKTSLGRGQYSSMAESSDMDDAYNKWIIDMIATFNVLIPDLKKDLNVKNIRDMEAIDSKKLLNVYLKVYMPWYNEWREILSSDED